MAHASDSSAQSAAEPLIVAALAAKLGVELSPRRMRFPSGSYCDVDGVSDDQSVFVEAFARQRTVKGGQRGKIARDALKLLTLRHHYPQARLFIALADPAVAKGLTATSWLAEALRTFNVEVVYVEIDADARDRVRVAEVRQVMVNQAPGTPAPES